MEQSENMKGILSQDDGAETSSPLLDVPLQFSSLAAEPPRTPPPVRVGEPKTPMRTPTPSRRRIAFGSYSPRSRGMRRSRGNSTDTPTRNPFLPSQIETAVVEDNYNQTMERTAYHFFDENVDDSMCSGASNTNGNQHARLSAPGSAGDPGPGNDCNFLSSRSGKFLEECLDMGLLGSGSFGEVIKVKKYIDGNFYAIKRSIQPLYSFQEKQNLLREVHALSSVEKSDHIVRYYTAWEEDSHIYICNELMDFNANVFKRKFTEATHRQYLTEKLLLEILRQCLEGLRDLHEHDPPMAHLDVKPDNIFFRFTHDSRIPRDENSNVDDDLVDKLLAGLVDKRQSEVEKVGVFKLGDLGLAVRADRTKEASEGDAKYLSEELLRGNSNDVLKADIFSLGASIYELALSIGECLPGSGVEWHRFREDPPYLQQFSSSWNGLLKSMMLPDPNARPSATMLLHHKLLRSDMERSLVRAKLMNRYLYNELSKAVAIAADTSRRIHGSKAGRHDVHCPAKKGRNTRFNSIAGDVVCNTPMGAERETHDLSEAKHSLTVAHGVSARGNGYVQLSDSNAEALASGLLGGTMPSSMSAQLPSKRQRLSIGQSFNCRSDNEQRTRCSQCISNRGNLRESRYDASGWQSNPTKDGKGILGLVTQEDESLPLSSANSSTLGENERIETSVGPAGFNAAPTANYQQFPVNKESTVWESDNESPHALDASPSFPPNWELLRCSSLNSISSSNSPGIETMGFHVSEEDRIEAKKRVASIVSQAWEASGEEYHH